MMVQVCNCGVKAVIAESLDGQLACLRCRGRAQASAEAGRLCPGCAAGVKPALWHDYGDERPCDRCGARPANANAEAKVDPYEVAACPAAFSTPGEEHPLSKGKCCLEAGHLGLHETSDRRCFGGPPYHHGANSPPGAPKADRPSAYQRWKHWVASEPYHAAAILRLWEATGACPDDPPTISLAEATASAERHLTMAKAAVVDYRRCLARAQGDVAAIEAAIAEHGRKAGGA